LKNTVLLSTPRPIPLTPALEEGSLYHATVPTKAVSIIRLNACPKTDYDLVRSKYQQQDVSISTWVTRSYHGVGLEDDYRMQTAKYITNARQRYSEQKSTIKAQRFNNTSAATLWVK
jgi:hypothetical protein